MSEIRKRLGIYQTKKSAERAAERHQRSYPERRYEVVPAHHPLLPVPTAHALDEIVKEEQKVQRELTEGGKKVKHMIDEEFNTLIREEENGVKTYESFIRFHNIHSNSPWGSHILKIVSDEREHLRLLKIDQDKMRKYITDFASK